MSSPSDSLQPFRGDRIATPAFTVVAGLATILLATDASAQGSQWFVHDARYTGVGGGLQQPTSVIGQFDRAPGLDVVTIGATFLTLQRNSGNGTLGAPELTQTAWSDWTAVAAIDFDRDGDLDVVGCAHGAEPRIFLNDGGGLFTLAARGSHFPGAVPDAYRIGVLDIDGDGFDDLFLGARAGLACTLLRNNRRGRFVDMSSTNLPVWSNAVSDVAVADLDGDGDFDLVLAQGLGSAFAQNVLLLNTGSGVFTAQVLMRPPHRNSCALVADFNGDRRPDLLFGNLDGPVDYWVNAGAGLFLDAGQAATNVYAENAVAGDFDGDGWIDLAVTAGQTQRQVATHQNLAGRSFAAAVSVPQAPALRLLCADMDRDGDLDLISPLSTLWRLSGTERHVLADVTVPLGGTWSLTLRGYQFDVVVPAVAGAQREIDLGTLGVLGLDPASLLVLDPQLLLAPTGEMTLTVPVPNQLSLVGARIWTQAAVVTTSRPFAPRLSNWIDTEIVR